MDIYRRSVGVNRNSMDIYRRGNIGIYRSSMSISRRDMSIYRNNMGICSENSQGTLWE